MIIRSCHLPLDLTSIIIFFSRRSRPLARDTNVQCVTFRSLSILDFFFSFYTTPNVKNRDTNAYNIIFFYRCYNYYFYTRLKGLYSNARAGRFYHPHKLFTNYKVLCTRTLFFRHTRFIRTLCNGTRQYRRALCTTSV